MQIKLKTSMAGPGGCHGLGAVLTVGPDIDERTAADLVAGGYAEPVGREVPAAPVTETAATAAPETATAAPQRRRKGLA